MRGGIGRVVCLGSAEVFSVGRRRHDLSDHGGLL